MAMDPTERSLQLRLAAHDSWAKTPDRAARTAAARRVANVERFERQVDPDGTLPPHERAQRAESARKAYFTELALRSVQKRRLEREARQAAEQRRLERRAQKDLAYLESVVDPRGALPPEERRRRAKARAEARAKDRTRRRGARKAA